MIEFKEILQELDLKFLEATLLIRESEKNKNVFIPRVLFYREV